MEKKAYTIVTHVRRLKIMLKKAGYLKSYCPAAPRFNTKMMLDDWNYSSKACNICRDFVGSEFNMCPCHYFGSVIARKKTKEAIKEYEKNK